MRLTDMDLLDEVFTHIDDVTGVQTSYNVTKLVAHLEAINFEQVAIPVEEHHARFCFDQRGVEEDRLAVLMAHPERVKKPIVFMFIEEENRHLLLDGTHRYVLAFILQVPHFPGYIVPSAIVKPFIIEDAPQTTEEQLMKHSGLTALRALFGK